MQLITIPGAFTRAPRLKRDGIINAGTRFLYDFGRSACWPAQAAPVLASTFTNLVEPSANVAGEQTAAVDNNTLPLGWDARGGIIFGGDGDTQHARINLGKAYDVGAMSDVLLIAWLRLPTVASFASTRPILSYQDLGHPNGGLTLYWEFNSGNPLIRARARVASQTTGAPDAGFAVGFDNLVQVAVRLTRAAGTSTIRLYTNGVLRATNSSAKDSWQTMANLALWIGSPNSAFSRSARHTIYRVSMENLAESGADPVTQIAADYSANLARFA